MGGICKLKIYCVETQFRGIYLSKGNALSEIDYSGVTLWAYAAICRRELSVSFSRIL